jgi:hypothetical protein
MMKPARLARIAIALAVWLGTGSILAFLAPYGTRYLGWPGLWLYWMGMTGVGWVAGLGVEALLERYRPQGRLWARMLAAGLAASLAVILASIAFLVWRGEHLAPGSYASIVLQVSVLVGVITAVYGGWKARRPGADAARPSGIGPALLDRLPSAHRQAELYALMAEDHYLRVFSSAGEALIRMRLGDALLALEAVDGARTHRSWWVARPAVREVRRVTGRIELVLVNDAVAPVSRTCAAALREAGWL